MSNKRRLTKEQIIQNLMKNSKPKTGHCCRFDKQEIETLYDVFKCLCAKQQKPRLDRLCFREILHNKFDLTEDIIMDRIFRAFDKDNDGVLSDEEWIYGLATFLKGELEEKIQYCFMVYDLNADGYISREEMFHLLKNSQVKHTSEDDPDEGVKELVEIALKKLDVDHDGRCSLDDFRSAVQTDNLLLEALGPCLPPSCRRNNFLQLVKGNLVNQIVGD
ncbi:EF-hand calcium-binding domain-containing protein 1-like [Gigantopelta aegis]|uniref:EF-hand calcium-binding domain-containing protein 1-like n=1 Tax=Gigantopelta aegis TaxID=1735272 RepID=UPI001B88D2F9|nr:EF-hand calcium-binding domain-containing protein 1-like [Gigantopelta aegis]